MVLLLASVREFQPFDLFRLFAQFFIWPEGVVIEDRR